MPVTVQHFCLNKQQLSLWTVVRQKLCTSFLFSGCFAFIICTRVGNLAFQDVYLHTYDKLRFQAFVVLTVYSCIPSPYAIFYLWSASTCQWSTPFSLSLKNVLTTFFSCSNNIGTLEVVILPLANLSKAFLALFLSTKRHVPLDITVLMQCSSSVQRESKVSVREKGKLQLLFYLHNCIE